MSYVERFLDISIASAFAEASAVFIVGPRASGKTTTARRFARTVVQLDREAEAAPFRADADALLATLEPPVLLDEWQVVPEVLGSVKRAVDSNPEPGLFLLTGSVHGELLESAWALTGRALRFTQWGMSEREVRGTLERVSFFDCAFDGNFSDLPAPSPAPSLPDYVALALRGSYPELALGRISALRAKWLESYLEQILVRDAALVDQQRDPQKLRRYLFTIAANNAGVVEHKTLYDAAGISRGTAAAYDSLLELLFVTQQVPAWYSNRLKRLTKSPKRLLTEPAMMTPLLGVDKTAVLRDGNWLGRTLESFAFAQLRAEQGVASTRPSLYHLRQHGGQREVDLIAEYPNGTLVGIEIKATAAPSLHDARHLLWLKENLGDRMIAGVVLHTGPRPFALSDDIHALPMACLWS